MNQQLKELYNSKWQELYRSIEPLITDDTKVIKPASPLLISLDENEDYEKSDIKIMVVGQETNGWHNIFEKDPIAILDSYYHFITRGKCWSYGGQFWNSVKRFINLLKNKYPNKSVGFIYNNLVKIGKSSDKGFPPDYIYHVEKEHFNILKDEIEILKPDIVLFLSGANYDHVLFDKLGNVAMNEVETFTKREFSVLEIENVKFAFRTYHPNYLLRVGIDRYFNAILDRIEIR
jgi:hypothetical protein